MQDLGMDIPAIDAEFAQVEAGKKVAAEEWITIISLSIRQ